MKLSETKSKFCPSCLETIVRFMKTLTMNCERKIPPLPIIAALLRTRLLDVLVFLILPGGPQGPCRAIRPSSLLN